MHTLLLTDHEVARDEQALLSRLSIGLADAGVSAVIATPGETGGVVSVGGVGGVLCSAMVNYVARGYAWSLSRRVNEFLEGLPDHFSLVSDDDSESSVVHVWGRGAWAFALRLREDTGVGLVFELNRAGDVEALAKVVKREMEASGAVRPIGVVSTGERMLERFRHAALGVDAAIARWGVHASGSVGVNEQRDTTASLGVFAPIDRGSDADVRDVLEAVTMLSGGGESSDLLVFLDSRGGGRHGVWRAARRLGVLDRLTLVSDVEQRMEHFLQTSLLVVPQRLAECRSILLGAMATGRPIIARADPDADWLIDGKTAMLVGADRLASASLGAKAWADVIAKALRDTETIHRLRESARGYVRERHTVTGYVKALVKVYERCGGVGRRD